MLFTVDCLIFVCYVMDNIALNFTSSVELPGVELVNSLFKSTCQNEQSIQRAQTSTEAARYPDMASPMDHPCNIIEGILIYIHYHHMSINVHSQHYYHYLCMLYLKRLISPVGWAIL